MKLYSYLTELSMKADTKIDVAKQKGKFYNAKITLTNGVEWLYTAEKYGKGEHEEWVITFFNPENTTIDPKAKHDVALETFAAVVELTKQFLQTEKPEKFSFVGHGKSRESLYKLLANKITKLAPYESVPYENIGMGKGWRFIKK